MSYRSKTVWKSAKRVRRWPTIPSRRWSRCAITVNRPSIPQPKIYCRYSPSYILRCITTGYATMVFFFLNKPVLIVLNLKVQVLLEVHDKIALKRLKKTAAETDLPPTPPTPPQQLNGTKMSAQTYKVIGLRKKPDEPLVRALF